MGFSQSALGNAKELKGVFRQLNNWRYQLYPYIQNIALDLGLLAGHRDYVRFIVLGRSRSGSNYLRGLLNSHSQIMVLGEIFQNQESIGWAYPGYLNSKRVFSMYLNNPINFVEKKVYKKFPRQIAAVGFKIFYYHAQNGKQQQVWDYLRDQKTIKVIHIKRRNILRTHLSRKLAALTDTWVNTDDSRRSRQVLDLDYDECLKDFVQTRAWERSYDALFSDHAVVEVYYEDLASNYAALMLDVQKYLGVVPEVVAPQTYKQASRLLSEVITNYDELKARFSGSDWESFFEE